VKLDPIKVAMQARVNMELLDLAAEILERVRPGSGATEDRLLALTKQLRRECGRQLDVMDKALGKDRSP